MDYTFSDSTARATAIGFTAVLMWGGLAPAVALTREIPAFYLNAIAFGLALGFSIIYWSMSRQPLARAFHLPPRVWALGIYGIFGFHACYFLAFRHAPAVEALLIVNLWPLLLVLMSAALTRDRLTLCHLLGISMGFAGVTALVAGNSDMGFSPNHLTGYAYAFASAIIWSSYSVLSHRIGSAMPSQAMGAFCGAAALLFAIFHYATETAPAMLTARDWLCIAALGLGPVGIAFYAWDYGMKHGDIRMLGALAYLGPIIGTTLLIAFGFSPFGWHVVAAAALIVGGAAVGSLGSRSPRITAGAQSGECLGVSGTKE